MASDLCRVSWLADGGIKWGGATRRSQSRHPCRLPRPRRPRWLLGGESGPVVCSAGSARSVMAPPPGRPGE